MSPGRAREASSSRTGARWWHMDNKRVTRLTSTAYKERGDEEWGARNSGGKEK